VVLKIQNVNVRTNLDRHH